MLPWGWLYSIIMHARNALYDLGIWQSCIFDTTVISVGNLTLGGTGKTPCIEYLVLLLKNQFRIAVLSRGYKRITKSFKIADRYDTALTIGDESWQVYQKLGTNSQVMIAVAENRVQGIKKILATAPGTQVILLDDGFQHRRVVPHLNILLTEFDRPFFTDHVLPVGRLRESRKAAQRADVVIVTKCPHPLPSVIQQYFQEHIRKYCGNQPPPPIFFTVIRYGSPLCIIHKTHVKLFAKHVLLITGIANAAPMVQYVAQHYHLVQHMVFKDHHSFTFQDIQKILSTFHGIKYQQKCILTTEKDSVRLRHPTLQAVLQHIPIFYLPITMEFITAGETFNQLVFNTIQQHNSFCNSF